MQISVPLSFASPFLFPPFPPECRICGLEFAPDVEEDREEHELQHMRVGPSVIDLRFWHEGKRSRWQVRDINTDQGVTQEDAIQVMDDPRQDHK